MMIRGVQKGNGLVMLKVAKFGGSSVADAGQFKKVKSIVKADPTRRFVVVSACGRRFKNDAKVTDLLYLVNAHVRYHVSCDDLLDDIGQRFFSIADELGLTYPIREEYATFADKARAGEYTTEELVSRGEYFTAQLMAEYLDMPFLDATEVIAFHHDGTFAMHRTNELFDEREFPHGFVMPGFYGATREGQIKLLDRGGGDISGSIVAKCLGVDLYENWSDVSGMLSADPNIVKNPQPIKRITYQELRELSYMGASVLHEEAVFPVMEANIPIVVRNTNRPQDPGTIISDREDYLVDEPIITGVTGKRNFVAVHIMKDHMSNEVGYVRRVLSIFERYRISIEHIPSGIDSIAVVVQGADVKDCIWSIVADIKSELEPDQIKVVEDLALVSTVGRNMIGRPGVSGNLFAALGEAGISIRMIAQGSDEINIIVGVRDEDFERAINAIYHAFCEGDHIMEVSELGGMQRIS